MMKSSTPPTKNSRPLIFLFGPTASGKTGLIEEFFSHGYQIVGADSVQVYKGLDIGSAKPSVCLMGKIRHHLVDILEPWQQFTVGQFVTLADEAVEKIYAEGDIPLICGGTAYYFRHFLYGLAETPIADTEVRKRVEKELQKEGSEALYKKLKSVDPISAERINIHDVYRITRALEVYYQSGRPLSSFAVPHSPRKGLSPLILSLEREKEELHKRIELRVEQMFDEGLVDEITKLRRMKAEASWPGLGGIGYAEFFQAFASGCDSLSDIKEKIIRNSKKYAKRQITFFKSFTSAIPVHPDDRETISKLVNDYLKSFEY